MPATKDQARIAASKLSRTGDVLVGREEELAILDQTWENPQTCIVQIVAPGGVGLVKQQHSFGTLPDSETYGREAVVREMPNLKLLVASLEFN